MDVFKKLVVVRRRNHPSGSVVSDDGVDDGDDNFCYHRQDDDSDAEMVGEDKGGIDGTSNGISGNGGSSSSLYGRRRHSGSPTNTRPPMMAVVTSNKFDSEETFSMVARTMICRYKHQNISEREAILGNLGNDDDLRAFIEALDQKCIVLSAQNTDGMNNCVDGVEDDNTTSEIVFETRSIFDATLKAMWREKELSSSSTIRQDRNETVAGHDEYRKRHPKTPKNLRMSPMRTSSYNYKNHGIISQSESLDSACSEGSNNCTFRPLKRPRRWFFPQNKSERLVTTLSSSSAIRINPFENKKPFPIKAALLKFHFDFGSSSSNSKKKNNSLIFGDLERGGPKPVQSLQLDGTSSPYASMWGGNGSVSTSYIPPTSPIRKVSIEMKPNGDSVERNQLTTNMGESDRQSVRH